MDIGRGTGCNATHELESCGWTLGGVQGAMLHMNWRAVGGHWAGYRVQCYT